MPEKLRGGYAMTDAQSWANDIGTEIASGKYKTLAAGWLKSMTLSDYTSTAMVWATDANAFVCTQVMPNGYTTLETGDLDGAYYTSNTATIDLQIAKGMPHSISVTNTNSVIAGYRLAAWLNLMNDGVVTKREAGPEAEAEAEILYDPFTGEDMQADGGALYNRFLADQNSEARQARRVWEAVHGPGCGHAH
jgi:hypothetical protein